MRVELLGAAHPHVSLDGIPRFWLCNQVPLGFGEEASGQEESPPAATEARVVDKTGLVFGLLEVTAGEQS